MKKTKKAIQGHPIRGKEVIQLLESFGGKNKWNLTATDDQRAFYIDDATESIYWFPINKHTGDREIYTLECFEKIFPFKIGDKITDGFEKYLIIDMDLSACELNYKVRTSLGTVFWVRTCDLIAHHYRQVEEMKKERNITLTLEKAKEWYKKGGELKEIALQAFTEKELTKVDLPKTWEEYTQQHFHREGYVLTHLGDIAETTITGSRGGENLCLSKKSAEAHLAMIQLEQLRDCWRQGWEPIWDVSHKWCIHLWGNELNIGITTNISRFLTFPTKEMAEEFLKCFKDLIEKAKDLI